MKHKLLLWNSKNHGLTVTLRSVLTLFEKKNIKIKEVLLLQTTVFDAIQTAELAIYKNSHHKQFETYRTKFEGREQQRIEQVYKQTKELKERKIKPLITQKGLYEIKSVTDYQSIYNALRKYLKTLSIDIQLHINVSPGTPQMHTVWLMLNASGYLPPTVKIWSSQYDRDNNRYLFHEIKFKPQTYLNEIFESAYQKNLKIRLNPNDTLSSKRQQAESQLRLFASIPETPILLIGERGVGKTTYVEQYIRAEHYQNKHFQVLPCGIFSEELMRSELFGYKAGAFTGANKDKIGIFHKFKNGGLLFLDEIHDLSKPLQRQLMQVLQSGEFLPIGGKKAEKTHFRLVTATNLSFEALTQTLSMDFLDRIAQFIVAIPPLRESREDILRYWEDTWENISDTTPPITKTLTTFLNKDALEGNFRDLQRLANYLFAFSKIHPTQKAVHLAIEAVEQWQFNIVPTDKQFYFQPNKNYGSIVNQFNQDVAVWAVKKYGSRKKACEVLDMSEAWLSKAINSKSR